MHVVARPAIPSVWMKGSPAITRWFPGGTSPDAQGDIALRGAIPRNQMPQVKVEHLDDFRAHLAQSGFPTNEVTNLD